MRMRLLGSAMRLPGALDHAGLIERAPVSGREVRYRLRDGALVSARVWLDETDAAWEKRLGRLKHALERRS